MIAEIAVHDSSKKYFWLYFKINKGNIEGNIERLSFVHEGSIINTLFIRRESRVLGLLLLLMTRWDLNVSS